MFSIKTLISLLGFKNIIIIKYQVQKVLKYKTIKSSTIQKFRYFWRHLQSSHIQRSEFYSLEHIICVLILKVENKKL